LTHADVAVETARKAAQPARNTVAIGFRTGHQMDWPPRAMRVLHGELKNIQVTVSSDYPLDLALTVARGHRKVLLMRCFLS
jgi:LysR family hca operon transcriptional activator